LLLPQEHFKLHTLKLLFITQKIDPHATHLGFIYYWLLEMIPHFEKIHVISLHPVRHNTFPKCVTIDALSLSSNTTPRILKFLRFYWCIFFHRKEYQVVFVHMTPIYIVLGGLFWKLFRKKIFLWYTHSQSSISLKIASLFCSRIFTAHARSFPFVNPKVKDLGHGIPLDLFQPKPIQDYGQKQIKLLYTGRISPAKNIFTLIDACQFLKQCGVDFHLNILGIYIERNALYYQEMISRITHFSLTSQITILPAVSYKKCVDFYRHSDFLINLSRKGFFDKNVLESMACGTLCFFCNPLYNDSIPEKYQKYIFFKEKNCKDLSQKIIALSRWPSQKMKEFKDDCQEMIHEKHDLKSLIKNIKTNMEMEQT